MALSVAQIAGAVGTEQKWQLMGSYSLIHLEEVSVTVATHRNMTRQAVSILIRKSITSVVLFFTLVSGPVRSSIWVHEGKLNIQ